MDNTHGNNRIWTTNNGFISDSFQSQTLGNLGARTTVVSSQITERSVPGNGFNSTRCVDAATDDDDRVALRKATAFNSNLIGVQSKFRRKYYHKIVLGALALLIILLIIAIIILSLKSKQSNEICHSKECIHTAANLIYAMDEETDPCEDFYKFTCGNWANEHPRPDSVTSNDWFRERQAKTMRKLREFVKTNASDADPEAVGKVKSMYKSCMNTELLDKRNLEPLVYYLKEFKLPLVPSGLNITLSAESTKKYFGSEQNSSIDFDWLQSVVLIKKILGMDVIIGFEIFADPLNNTVNRIALGTPETDSALPFNNDDLQKLLRKIKRKTLYNNQDNDDDVEAEEEKTLKQTTGLTAYVSYVKKVVSLYLEYLDSEIDAKVLGNAAGDMALSAVKVAKAIYKLKDEAENTTKPSILPSEDIVYTTVHDLQEQTDKLIAPKSLPIWQKYFDLIFADTNHTKGFIDGLKIITSHADILYLQKVVEYLVEAPPAHIEFFIWLNIVEEIVLHTTSDMRVLHTEYMRLVVGTESGTPRSLYCTQSVNNLMGMAVSYALVDDVFIKDKLPKVKKMLNDIRNAFDGTVRGISWLDSATRRSTLEKSRNMKSFIGFPEWLSNSTALDDYYAGVQVNESTHLENMVGVLYWQMRTKLDNLHKPESFGWATSPSNVNAFHTFQANTITIPIAILQFPFYELGLEALNYGSIGTILGHELTHGFDDSGRMFDKNGNMVQWWSNETINEYVNRTECFVDQYNHYFLADIGEYVDGELTLGENIADNGGMREAYYAYQLYIKDMGRERLLLPGLEHYTHEQLFFISFGNLWCETLTPAASRYALEDSHCPGKIRLKGVLTNSNEFARTFNCPKGSTMNPGRPKCRIW